MKTILAPDRMVWAVCGEQAGCPDQSWRMTTHCTRVPCEDGILFFHCMTCELLLLSQKEEEAIGSDPEIRRILAKKRFLVPRDCREVQLADEVRRAVEYMTPAPDAVTVFTVFPTTDCNARCFYCYEIGRSRKYMSDQTARDAAAYMLRVSKGRPIRIRWFGGEPLHNMPAMDTIVSELRKAGAVYESTAISNGYYFDAETIKKARDLWNLIELQITLDGTEAVYNQTKAYINAEDSAYRRVMENISLLLESGVELDIRLNMDSRNADDLEKLIDELADRFGKYPNLHVYCALLRVWGTRHEFGSVQEAIDRHRAVCRKLVDRGISRKRFLQHRFPVANCIADSGAAMTILPDGRLGKCEHCSDDGFVGSIYSDTLDEDAVQAFRERRDTFPACMTCRWYPCCIIPRLCADMQGGCTPIRQYLCESNIHSMIVNSYRAARDKGTDSRESPETGAYPDSLTPC